MDKEILEAGSRVRPGRDRGTAKTAIGGKAPLARIRARLMKTDGSPTTGAVAESRRTMTSGWPSSRGARPPPWRCRALMRCRSARRDSCHKQRRRQKLPTRDAQQGRGVRQAPRRSKRARRHKECRQHLNEASTPSPPTCQLRTYVWLECCQRTLGRVGLRSRRSRTCSASRARA